jgi:hypothetical protein
LTAAIEQAQGTPHEPVTPPAEEPTPDEAPTPTDGESEG